MLVIYDSYTKVQTTQLLPDQKVQIVNVEGVNNRMKKLASMIHLPMKAIFEYVKR